jgi:ATP-binding cassette subfamily F protein 3
MISIENLSKSFGKQVLFDRISFKVNAKERVGLVGRNGHGKTTMLQMITGDAQPDEGKIVIPKNYRVGYVKQQLEFTEKTILQEGMKGLPETEKGSHWKVEKILAGLGFSQKDMERSPMEFSGGFQVRLNLAKVLVSEPNLLLLDEPTNYLDITSIRWVIRFLIAWPGELILITHDRGFMDQVVTHIVGIHRLRARKIQGTTEKYYDQIAQEEEIHEKTRLNEERKRKEVELFISRFRAKARLANLVQSRIKNLEKMGKREKLEKIRDLDFSFRSCPFPGKYVMNVQELSFSYDSADPLIQNLEISISAGERVCVIGKNGRGKTTLLRLLSGEQSPQRGSVSYHPGVVKGYFEQTNTRNLVESRTVVEEVLYASEDTDLQMARNICGAMLFEGDAALKKISVLSGGEKSRVMLGKLLATPVNLLLLDEPSNHLDMESCDALLASLDNFDGTVVMVTHNEMFLHALADKLIVFQKGAVDVFEGGYDRFLEKVGWEEETDRSPKDRPETGDDKITRKALRKRRSEIIQERSRILKPLERRVAIIERRIEDAEKNLVGLNDEMVIAARSGDGDRIKFLSKTLKDCQQIIDDGFEQLESLFVDIDSENARFEKILESLTRQADEKDRKAFETE